MRLTPDSRAPAKADPSARAGVVVVVVVVVVFVVVVVDTQVTRSDTQKACDQPGKEVTQGF
jgi:hypothetical protein